MNSPAFNNRGHSETQKFNESFADTQSRLSTASFEEVIRVLSQIEDHTSKIKEAGIIADEILNPTFSRIILKVINKNIFEGLRILEKYNCYKCDGEVANINKAVSSKLSLQKKLYYLINPNQLSAAISNEMKDLLTEIQRPNITQDEARVLLRTILTLMEITLECGKKSKNLLTKVSLSDVR